MAFETDMDVESVVLRGLERRGVKFSIGLSASEFRHLVTLLDGQSEWEAENGLVNDSGDTPSGELCWRLVSAAASRAGVDVVSILPAGCDASDSLKRSS